MPSYAPPFPELKLIQLLMESLAELPISVQMTLFSEQSLANRPLLYVDREDVRTISELGDIQKDWFLKNRERLAFGLIHWHGLDVDRIALLREFNAIQGLYRGGSQAFNFYFGAVQKSFGVELRLEEVAITIALISEFEAAFRDAFAPLGLPSLQPTIRLEGGSISTFLSSSAAGIGLLLLLDVCSSGATLPVTLPIYAKTAFAGALIVPKAIDFASEQRNKWAIGSKTFEEAVKIAQEAQTIPDKALADAKLRAEIDKISAERAKLEAEALKARADAVKAQAEALAVLEKAAPDAMKAEAETEKLRAEAVKLLAERSERSVEVQGAGWTPPPAAQFSAETISKAGHTTFDPSVVALSINAGMPILAKATSLGVEISRPSTN